MPDHPTHPPVPDAPFDCHAAVARLWDYLDGELGATDRRAVDAHLAECERCPPHFTFERAFLRAVRQARREPEVPEATGRGRLRDRVVAALAEEGYAPP